MADSAEIRTADPAEASLLTGLARPRLPATDWRLAMQTRCVLLQTTPQGPIAWSAIKLASGELDYGGTVSAQLLVATEQLAARFMRQTLHIHPRSGDAGFLEEMNYRPGDTGNMLLRRISRRQTHYAKRINQLLQDLGLPEDYASRHRIALQAEARKLVSIGADIYQREQKLAPGAARAWHRMHSAAAVEHVELQVVSAWRSVDYQAGIVRRKLEAGQSVDRILRVSAAPGFSEHHTGRALDLTTPGSEVLEESFEQTAAFDWLARRAEDFGFFLSFPRNNPHGIAWEPWHWAWRPPQIRIR